jgi:Domain of unknown function (DUF3806)
MGVIVNIIEAIRRIGSSSQRSALKRQDEFLAGKTVHDRGVQLNGSGDKGMQSFVATIDPVPESVRPFDSSELSAVEENAAQVAVLSQRYLGDSSAGTNPEQLDAIFAAWAHSPERSATSNEEVVQILGAAFGKHCIAALGMRWVVVTDADGSAAAIQGIARDFRGFPFHSIWKRIRDDEQDFFAPIFATLQKRSESSSDVPVSSNISLERTRER